MNNITLQNTLNSTNFQLDALKSLNAISNEQLSNISGGLSNVSNDISSLSKVLANNMKESNNGISNLNGLISDMDLSLQNIISGFRDSHDRYQGELLDKIDSMQYAITSPRETESDEITKMGLGLLKIGETKEAIELLERAIEINPMNYKPLLALANYYYEINQYELALDYATKCLNRHEYIPSEALVKPIPYKIKAKILEQQGNIQEAYNVIELAVKQEYEPHTPASLYYQFAQLAAKNDILEVVSKYLGLSIGLEPRYFGLSLLDESFNTHREQVNAFLEALKNDYRDYIKRELEVINSKAEEYLVFSNEFTTIQEKFVSISEQSYADMKYFNSQLSIFKSDVEMALEKLLHHKKFNLSLEDNDIISLHEARNTIMVYRVRYATNGREALRETFAQLEKEIQKLNAKKDDYKGKMERYDSRIGFFNKLLNRKNNMSELRDFQIEHIRRVEESISLIHDLHKFIETTSFAKQFK